MQLCFQGFDVVQASRVTPKLGIVDLCCQKIGLCNITDTITISSSFSQGDQCSERSLIGYTNHLYIHKNQRNCVALSVSTEPFAMTNSRGLMCSEPLKQDELPELHTMSYCAITECPAITLRVPMISGNRGSSLHLLGCSFHGEPHGISRAYCTGVSPNHFGYRCTSQFMWNPSPLPVFLLDSKSVVGRESPIYCLNKSPQSQ